MFDLYHVRERVLEAGIDLSKSPAQLDLVVDNAADVPFVESIVPKKFEDVPTEVTETRSNDGFLPCMLRARGLMRASDPSAVCPQPNEQQRPDLDAIRAQAARIDLEADLKKWSHPGSDWVVEEIGIDLEGKVSSLDVVVDKASDVAPVRAEVPETFEGVPTEVEVIETIDTDGGAMLSGKLNEQSE